MTKPGGEIPQDAVERAREVSNAWLGDHMADRIELETAIAAALHAYAEERVREARIDELSAASGLVEEILRLRLKQLEAGGEGEPK